MTQNYFDHYNTLANSKTVSRADVFTYCLIKAIRAKTEDKVELAKILLKKAFTAPTNPNKIANGALSYWGYNHARCEARTRFKYTDQVNKFLSGEEQELFGNLLSALVNYGDL